MSEHELREGLAAAVADEPPLAFDADRLVEQAERGLRRRRSLLAAGAATVVIAAGAVTVPLALGSGGPATVEAAGPGLTTSSPSHPADPASTSASTSVAKKDGDIPWPPAGVQPANYTVQQLQADGERFNKYLDKALPAVAPGVSHLAIIGWGGESVGAGPQKGERYLDGSIRFQFKGVVSSAVIQVNGPGADDGFAPSQACVNTTTCTRKIQADGTELLTLTIGTAGGGKMESVYDFRTDGTVVSASGYNYDVTAGSIKPSTPDVTLSTAALTTLATDPELHL